MTAVRLALLAGIAAVLLAVALAAAIAPPESPEQRVDRIASGLRCPVCQALSVRDSPSGTARAVRDVIARRVAEGRSDDEIRDEFVRAYGEWILLSPPLDVRALLWALPLAILIPGLLVAARWLRAPPAPAESAAEASGARLLVLRRLAAEELDE